MAKKPTAGRKKPGTRTGSVEPSDAAPDKEVVAKTVEDSATATKPEVVAVDAPDAVDDPVEDDPLHEDDHEDEVHEEHGSPLSRKLLTGLVLLIVGAGLALWGAPKLARMVPSGMEPLTRWLTPGLGDTQNDIAALRAELDARLAALPVPVDEAGIEAIAGATAGPATEALSKRIDELSDQAAAAKSAELQARLAIAETRLEGLATEIGSLSDQLSNFTIGSGEMTAETAGQIAGYRATVDGLRAEIEAVSSRQGEMSARIDTVAAVTSRQMEEAQATLEAAETEAALKSGMAGVRAGLSAGVPFEAALAELTAADAQPVPEALAKAAADGIPTLQSLLQAFPDLAHAAISTSINASAGDGTLSRLGAFVESRVATRSLTPQEGMTPDAILSRMDAALKTEDLATVLREAEALPSEATAIMADWLAETGRRYAATDAFARLEAALAPSN